MRSPQGFTLVELLIVVVILGVLASIVVPEVSSSQDAARANMLAADLRATRTQTWLFKWQHRGVAPGYPDLDISKAPTSGAFVDHMTKATTSGGIVAPPGTVGFPYGPYLTRIPPNPVNGKSTVEIVGSSQALTADDSHGWLFKPSTMQFKPDCTGSDQRGKAFIDF